MILYVPLFDGAPIIEVTLSFAEFILKQQKPVYSIDLFVSMANFKFPQPEWTHPFMTTPISIFCNQLLISINLNQHANEKDFFTILF